MLAQMHWLVDVDAELDVDVDVELDVDVDAELDVDVDNVDVDITVMSLWQCRCTGDPPEF